MNVTDMTSEMDDHGFSDTLTTRKVAMVNDTIADICSRETWPFLEKALTYTFDGVNGKPSNFPTDWRAQLLLTDGSAGIVINHERADVLRKRYPAQWTQLGAPPLFFYTEGMALKAFPIPPAGYTLDGVYLANHPTVDINTLEATILIPARHHRAIVVGSLYKLYALEDDPDNFNLFKGEYEMRIAHMREDLMHLQYDRPDRIWLTDEADYDSSMFWPY